MELVEINNRENEMGGNRIFTVEGNVAAGKSSLCALLDESPLVKVVYEPVKVWQESYPDNLLERFYNDQNRWAFTFQMAAFISRTMALEEVLALEDHSNYIMDRSIYCDKHVFARSLHELGKMDDTEFMIYNNMWSWMDKRWEEKPEKTIYIKTPPEICLERLKQRSRDEEAGVPLSYLEQLDRMHEEWLGDLDNVITIDGSLPFNTEEILTELNII